MTRVQPVGLDMSESLDVIVIGAGAAGLAATRTLLDAGLSAKAFEARDRIGGVRGPKPRRSAFRSIVGVTGCTRVLSTPGFPTAGEAGSRCTKTPARPRCTSTAKKLPTVNSTP